MQYGYASLCGVAVMTAQSALSFSVLKDTEEESMVINGKISVCNV